MKILIPTQFILSLLLGGCNGFTNYYKPIATDTRLAPYSGKTEIDDATTKVEFQTDTDELEALGYACLGTSSFTTPYLVTENQLQSQGKNVGADRVLWIRESAGSSTFVIPGDTY